MPGRLQLIRKLRDFGYVVWHGDAFATSTSKYGKIARGCEVRTKHAAASDLEFHTQQCVLNLDPRSGSHGLEGVRPRPQFANSFGVDVGQPDVFEFSFDLRGVIFGAAEGFRFGVGHS